MAAGPRGPGCGRVPVAAAERAGCLKPAVRPRRKAYVTAFLAALGLGVLGAAQGCACGTSGPAALDAAIDVAGCGRACRHHGIRLGAIAGRRSLRRGR